MEIGWRTKTLGPPVSRKGPQQSFAEQRVKLNDSSHRQFPSASGFQIGGACQNNTRFGGIQAMSQSMKQTRFLATEAVVTPNSTPGVHRESGRDMQSQIHRALTGTELKEIIVASYQRAKVRGSPGAHFLPATGFC